MDIKFVGKYNLVVCDYSTCSVDFYYIEDNVVTEEFLKDKGYRESEISWMRADNLDVNCHEN